MNVVGRVDARLLRAPRARVRRLVARHGPVRAPRAARLARGGAAAAVALLKRLPPARTLDVACGTGFLTRHLPGDVTGLDQSATMVDVAARGSRHATPCRARRVPLPFADGAFERLFTSHFYGHLLPGEEAGASSPRRAASPASWSSSTRRCAPTSRPSAGRSARSTTAAPMVYKRRFTAERPGRRARRRRGPARRRLVRRRQGRPCSSAPLTLASSALSRYSASASGEPKRRPGAASAPWWQSTQCCEREPPRRLHARGALGEQALAEHEVAEQPALLGEPDLGAVGELARLAEVVHERGAQQQVGVQPRVQLARLERERAPPRPCARAARPGRRGGRRACTARAATSARSARRRAAPRAAPRTRGRAPRAPGARGSRRARRGRGRRPAGTPPDRPPRRARSRAARPAARRGSARRARRTRTRSPRSKRPGEQVGVPERARRAARRCGRAARAPGTACRCGPISRSLRVHANTPHELVAGAQRGERWGRRIGDGGHVPIMARAPDASACCYGDSDAAAALGAPPRRPPRPGAGLRVQGLERRRRRRHHARSPSSARARRDALRDDRPRGVLRLPGHAAEGAPRRGPLARDRVAGGRGLRGARPARAARPRAARRARAVVPLARRSAAR